jgi:hypothetical protein
LLFFARSLRAADTIAPPTPLRSLIHLGVEPLSIAFPWLVYAFAGYLPVAEVLCAWDRVIGLGSLEVLPVLAAAIFAFRADALAAAASAEEARAVLRDASQLKVVPLLQMYLFCDEK